LKQAFLEALFREMDLYKGLSESFNSIYIGGGTPSVLTPEEISCVLKQVYAGFVIEDNAEITMEVNPGTIDDKTCLGYKNAGVNRLNIGVQSFSDNHLKFLGRIHSAAQSRAAIETARKAGFHSLGIDLIYCLPNQSLNDWKKDLKAAVRFKPDHLSCYLLTFEPGTPLTKDMEKGIYPFPDENISRIMFLLTIRFLETQGYLQYEISNFARVGEKNPRHFESRHNRKYWNFVPYLGLGPSAHSYLKLSRFWNHASVTRYIQDLKNGKFPVAGKEMINHEQRKIETILLGLRKKEGFSLKHYRDQFGHTLPAEKLLQLQHNGYLQKSNDRCALTPKGMCILDSICELLA
jgi:oxygen-independent coproporphyrinogen-3 oxidase